MKKRRALFVCLLIDYLSSLFRLTHQISPTLPTHLLSSLLLRPHRHDEYQTGGRDLSVFFASYLSGSLIHTMNRSLHFLRFLTFSHIRTYAQNYCLFSISLVKMPYFSSQTDTSRQSIDFGLPL